MVHYSAPLDDIRFALFELFDFENTVASLPSYEDATRDVVDAVLDEAAKFCEHELLPLNQSGDTEGCVLENGVVRTPKGFREAYRDFREGGWVGIAADPAHGGQGLPKTLHVVLEELICSTNLSFGTYPALSQGAYNALEIWGTEEQKRTFLPRLADGTWSGTMCLTEPHCGTDLGLIRTKAEPAGDGAYAISGTKIFISAGEHDLTENILHLVLAKLPDAPAGTKGISLFLVPKYTVGEDGAPGPRNAVECGSLEDKMGIKASSTCVMNFDGALGTMIGEPHGGMKAMFTMMNAARLAVGMQGLGLAETAYQSAVAYARDRLQGRSAAGPKAPDKPADPIIVHPDVRRNLLDIRARNEAARGLAVWMAMALDVAAKHPDTARRREADDLVALMTPIVKAYFTDYGFDATVSAQQVFGGHGYIKEWGMEQLVRDARIAQIYEGANGIQALDLVGRKLGQGNGRLLRRFFHPVRAFLESHRQDPELSEVVPVLAKAFGRLQQATATIAQKGLRDPEEGAAVANDYLRLFALVALGYVWARAMKVAGAKANGEDAGFYAAKLSTGAYFFARVMPETSSLFARIMAGKAPIMALDEPLF